MDVREYLQTIGAKGGKAGIGKSKRRSKAHYRRAQLASAKARVARRAGIQAACSNGMDAATTSEPQAEK